MGNTKESTDVLLLDLSHNSQPLKGMLYRFDPKWSHNR